MLQFAQLVGDRDIDKLEDLKNLACTLRLILSLQMRFSDSVLQWRCKLFVFIAKSTWTRLLPFNFLSTITLDLNG